MRVAWLMTDYPKNSQTFDHQEIVSIEKHGVEVVPIALNPPDESDLEQPEHRRAFTCCRRSKPRLGTPLRAGRRVRAGASGHEARALAVLCLPFAARPCATRAQQAALRLRR